MISRPISRRGRVLIRESGIDVAEDGAAYTIVDSIDAMVRALGKQTIAEYVENAAAERALREIGVEFAQGFYYARPLPASEVLAERATVTGGYGV